MEHGDVALLDQHLLNFEAVGRLDVFQIDAAEGIGDACDRVDESLRALCLDLDIDRVNAGEALEKQRLAFHHRFTGQGAQITQAEDGGAIADHGDQIALAGEAVGVVRVRGYRPDRFGHPRAVGQREFGGSVGRLAQFDADFPGAGEFVIVQCGLLEIGSHGFLE
ncbi:hypothetical protein FQZ97_902880 [compost metagenome]